MAKTTCPHCSHEIDIPEHLLPEGLFRCPYCMMDLRVPFHPSEGAEYANIEDDMMWDDDEEMGWSSYGDDDD